MFQLSLNWSQIASLTTCENTVCFGALYLFAKTPEEFAELLLSFSFHFDVKLRYTNHRELEILMVFSKNIYRFANRDTIKLSLKVSDVASKIHPSQFFLAELLS